MHLLLPKKVLRPLIAPTAFFVYNDGATIVKALHIDNPVAPRVLVDISKV